MQLKKNLDNMYTYLESLFINFSCWIKHAFKLILNWLLFYAYLRHTYPIKCQCCPHIETSQLICTANQLTVFYMRTTLALNGLTVKY